jgi:threonylcarbamoyladenosine tRNA methylthiotransferase MtaB
MADVIKEVTELTAGGCREVVLTGIETASYGKDLEDTDLASLLAEVDKIPNMGRVRLGSLDPSLITPKFVDRIADLKSLAPHFHLSLQSGSSQVLALMKRKYNAEMAMRAIELLREKMPNVQFTTDVIVGFPGESDDNFNETVEFAKKARFLMMHVFPYSKREGTLAAQMKDQIPTEIKRKRAAQLSEIAKEIRLDQLKSKISSDPCCSVLFETYRDSIAYGHTADFIEVAVKSDRPLHSEFHSVILTDTNGEICFGALKD